MLSEPSAVLFQWLVDLTDGKTITKKSQDILKSSLGSVDSRPIHNFDIYDDYK